MINILSKPRRLIWISFLLLLVGWLVPMLTVIQVIRPSFVLLFGSYALAISGLVMGLLGIYTSMPKKRGR